MCVGKLIFVGLGLNGDKDISLRGIEEIKKCDKVYAEFYTAKLAGTNIDKIEKRISKPIDILNRKDVEEGEKILADALNKKVVFLTCGDPMTATTHVDLRLRAMDKGIETKVVHGSSIITAVPGLLGLQHYKFGRTTTLAFPEKDYFPTSPYQVIKNNKEMGLHTLILLDIQAENERCMTANEGIDLLLEMENKLKKYVCTENNIACVVARAGSSNITLAADKLSCLREKDFGPPLHTLVLPGNLHFMEIEALVKLANLPAKLSEKLQKL